MILSKIKTIFTGPSKWNNPEKGERYGSILWINVSDRPKLLRSHKKMMQSYFSVVGLSQTIN